MTGSEQPSTRQRGHSRPASESREHRGRNRMPEVEGGAAQKCGQREKEHQFKRSLVRHTYQRTLWP